ncbi:MAG TPA: ABC transporter ATP-binding protein, partial [Clostridiaceae bacterium]|nr:ABC transporter ATP-binding protein [Clostridiaceae bacterium]
KYPGTDIYALKNVSIKLKIGERLAIVGMNGSGKTTFIKLLCRLYDPNEGEILLNGINIKKYDYEEYTRLFSIVFQDFKLFSFSIGQNVAASVDYDENAVKDALEKVGLKERLDKMPEGIRTPLYKDFDENGVEISGGEAQKIALARSLYRDSPIIILDEPTAALDPISEFDIYSKFNEIVGTKTAFYISHRLSSCRFCDEIAVFNEGQIIQKGTHDELLKDENGKYYELWNAQAKYYNGKESA